MRRIILAVFCALILSAICHAQPQTGQYQFGAFDSKGFDTINIGNLNANFELPVYSKPGRGMPFYYNLSYNSTVWIPATVGASSSWTPVDNWGWTASTDAQTGYLSYAVLSSGRCTVGFTTHSYSIYGDYIYYDKMGGAHPFAGAKISVPASITCTGIPATATATATDSSGYTLFANALADQVQTASGTLVVSPVLGMSGPGSAVDTNGNQISTNTSNQFTDTTGNVVLTMSGTAPSPTTYTYTDTSNTAQSVTINYISKTVQTAFGCSGISEFGPTNEYLISSIGYPDGTSYVFTYEQTPGVSGHVTGRLANVTLPEGGVLNYYYGGGCSGNGNGPSGIEPDGGTAELTRTMSSLTGSPTTTYTRTPGTNSTHTEVVDGLGNYSEYDFVNDPTDSNYTPYLINHKQYQGNTGGTLLISEQNCLNGATPDCTGQSLTRPIVSVSTTSTLNGSAVKQSARTFNVYGLMTDDKEYDYGSGSSGPELSETQISYAILGNGIVNRPSSIATLVPAGSGTVTISGVSYGYDQYSLTSTSGLPQHNSITGSRGNLTSVQYSTGAGSPASITTAQYYYDDAGQTLTSEDEALNTTSYSYDSATDSFLTGVTYPTTGSTAHSTSSTWDVVRGVKLTDVDLNSNTTTYTYDLMLRPYTISTPGGGYQTFAYSLGSSSPYTSVSTLHATGGSNIVATSYLDPYGRLVKSDSTDTPSDDLVTYSYDAAGNLTSVSNPYRSGGTISNTVTTFDALGRPTKIVDSDGASQQLASYSGNSVTATDEAGNPRELFTDGLGRIKEVLEPDSSKSLTLETDYIYAQNATAGSGSTFTTYQNIVNQKGGSGSSSNWRTRTFTLDALGRTASVTTPEAGTIIYTYPNGSGSCAGMTTIVCTRTDANSTSTTYSYDALNRLTGKTYGGSTIGTATSPVTYYYDQTSYNGLTISSGNGQRTGMTDGSGVTAFSYSPTGRVWAVEKTINGVTKQAGYSFNADGSTNLVVDFGGTIFTYSYDVSGRPTGVVDGSSNTYASNAIYDAAGQLTSLNHQRTSGGGAYVRSIQYNNRLQPYTISATLNGSTIQSLTYGFGTGGANNGNILSITNGMDSTRSQTYTYDYMNRLTSGEDASHWGETYTYDNWGNLYATTRKSGYPNGDNWTGVTANPNNQLSSLTYDAAGEVTADQYGNAFTYDAEGRILTGGNGTGSGTYVYDGDGNRVKKTVSGTTTLYWPCAGSLLDESNSSGTTMGKQVQFAGLLVWHEDASGNGNFLFHDHLGSIRVTGSASGSLADDNDYWSFGTLGHNYGSSPSDNHYLFTGDESDSETTSDYATFRNLGVEYGRFNRPDPYDGSYDQTNPQSLNRYSYALNNPINLTDSLGLQSGQPSDNDIYQQLPSPDGPSAGYAANATCTVDGLDTACNEVFNGAGGAIGGYLGGAYTLCPFNNCNSIGGVMQGSTGLYFQLTYGAGNELTWEYYNNSGGSSDLNGEAVGSGTMEEEGLPDPSDLTGGLNLIGFGGTTSGNAPNNPQLTLAATKPSGPTTICAGTLLLPSYLVVGCLYAMECVNGDFRIQGARCSSWAPYAYDECPKEIVTQEGTGTVSFRDTIIFPPNFCGYLP